MDRRNTAREIFVFNLMKTDFAELRGERFLVWEFFDRVWQISVRRPRTAHDPADPRQNAAEIKIKELSKARHDRT